MISLVGATLYPSVDTAGQIIQPDLHSGKHQQTCCTDRYFTLNL